MRRRPPGKARARPRARARNERATPPGGLRRTCPPGDLCKAAPAALQMLAVAAATAALCALRAALQSHASPPIALTGPRAASPGPGDDLRRLQRARWRLTSAPFLNITMVGMLRIAKRDESVGLASLSTLANTAWPLSWRAACSQSRHRARRSARLRTPRRADLDRALEAADKGFAALAQGLRLRALQDHAQGRRPAARARRRDRAADDDGAGQAARRGEDGGRWPAPTSSTGSPRKAAAPMAASSRRAPRASTSS